MHLLKHWNNNDDIIMKNWAENWRCCKRYSWGQVFIRPSDIMIKRKPDIICKLFNYFILISNIIEYCVPLLRTVDQENQTLFMLPLWKSFFVKWASQVLMWMANRWIFTGFELKLKMKVWYDIGAKFSFISYSDGKANRSSKLITKCTPLVE